ncbi:MAG: TlpA family protein disulfide reductase [Puniceicoccaceae bacterium]|nr:MAG: TlpA family protein disulfide reductase [Puniceicoccaceae bacterium]
MHRKPILITAAAAFLGLGLHAEEIRLSLTPEHTEWIEGGHFWGNMRFYNTDLALSTERPAHIHTEPAYDGKVHYGQITLGDAEDASFTFALVTPDAVSGDFQLFLDSKRDGNLANEGDGKFAMVRRMERDGIQAARLSTVVKSEARYADGSKQPYQLLFFGLLNQGELTFGYRRATSMTGSLELDGTTYKVWLVDNDNDAVFNKALDDDNNPVGGGEAGDPLWLITEVDGDQRTVRDARRAFTIGERRLVAEIAPNGTSLVLKPTTRPIPAIRMTAGGAPPAGERPPRPPLLEAGVEAPDFVAVTADGRELRLSDFRGQVVVIDFWATWCGPCLRALPKVDEVARTHTEGVTVLALNVWDNRAAFDRFIETRGDDFAVLFAHDPAGRGAETDIPRTLYNVSGIPTMYVIDADGKVVEGMVGAGGADRLDELIRQALAARS